MTTIAMAYCSLCESLRKFGKSVIETSETIGRARASAELARMGYHKQAKALMVQK